MTGLDPRAREIIEMISSDPVIAHEVVFKHRHKNQTPAFHEEAIRLWHGPDEKVSIQAFRGGAKSTLGSEEATIIMALLGEFRNGIILGEKYERACERLASIKYEIENNEFINQVFGNCVGPIWTEGKISLANGTVIQAYGRGQSLRGAKHHDQRPDYCVGDDIEDAESVKTEESKRATMAWFMSVVVPALDRHARIRVIGTPLDTGSLMERLAEDEGWISRKYPIEYIDGEGARVATWPDRFSLPEIDAMRENFRRMGMLLEYGREYLCEARSGETRVFTKDILRVKPRVRTWHPTWVVYDPARSVNETSAHTGKVVFSWIGNELVFWEAIGRFWRPDELTADIFATAEKYNPVMIAVEKTGLEEWIMQPIRQEAAKHQIVLPMKALNAPRGKIDFIRGLQPFFMSGEATMCEDMPDLVEQLLNFPVGRIDVPNAAAYALMLRPGLPVYEDFQEGHIMHRAVKTPGRYTVAVNYAGGALTGVIYRRERSRVTIYADTVIEGDPQQRAQSLMEWAAEQAGGIANCDVVVHRDHFERYATSGLVGALRKLLVDPLQGGDVTKGRGWFVEKLRSMKSGQPEVRVSTDATWTVNGLAAGYAFSYPKAGKGLSDRADEGVYRTLMEGLEAAMARSSLGATTDKDPPNYSYTKSGKRYVSAIAK